MEQNVPLAADGAERLDVLDDAGFVVDVHDRDELGVRPERRLQLGGVEDAVVCRVQPAHLEALFLQCMKYVGHRLVLGRHRDQVPAAVGAVTGSARNGEIVRFGRTGGPHQFTLAAAEQRGELLGGPRDMLLAAPPGDVPRRRIREIAAHPEQRCHDLDNARVDRGRCGVVQVDDIGAVCHEPCFLSRSTAARIPRRILTSFWSGRARMNSRRNRRIRWRGLSGSRNSTSVSTRSRCS